MKKLLVIMLIAMTLTACEPYKSDCIYTRRHRITLKDGWFVTDISLDYKKGEAVFKIEVTE